MRNPRLWLSLQRRLSTLSRRRFRCVRTEPDISVRSWTSSSLPSRWRSATRCASFLTRRGAERVRAPHGRARRRRHHARGVAQDRRPRLDRAARAGVGRRPRARPRRRGRRAGGDGPRAVPGPVLLVGDPRHARGARPRPRRSARGARGRHATRERSRSTKPATATRSSGCTCAPTAAAPVTSSTA